MRRAPDVERRLRFGPIEPAAEQPGWVQIAFWSVIWIGSAIFLGWCGSL